MTNQTQTAHAVVQKVKTFINREAIFKRLRTLISFLLSGKRVDFSLNIGGGSFTDGKKITVGVPESIMNSSFEEIYIMLTALAGHESQHVLSSNFKELERYLKRMRDFFTKENVAGQVSDKVSHSIANILEDGRIENILGKKMPGMKPKIRFLRMHDWDGSRSEGVDDMSMYLNTMLFISVLGIYPKGYHEFASKEVKEEIAKIKPVIIDAVQARTAKDLLMLCEEIITVHSKDFLLKHIQTANKSVEQFNKMVEMLEKMLKDSHKNSEESETQDSGGISIHIKTDKEGKGGSSGKKGKKKDKKKDEDGKGGSKEKTSKDKDKEKDGSGESSDKKEKDKKDGKDGDGEGEGSKSADDADDSKDDIGDPSGDSNDSNSDSDSEGETKIDENNMQLSEGDADDYEESGRDEDEYQQLLDEIREGLMDGAKDEISKAQRDEKKSSKEIDYSLSNQEIKEAIGNKGYKEYPNDFPLTHHLPPEVKVMANKFKKSIANIFFNKTRVNLAGQDKGVLNPDDLYKVGMGDYNIFQEEGRKTTSNYVAFILQDGSGSMMGEKEKYASYALSVIEEGLRDVIPYKMSTFNTGAGGITHHVVKNWNDKSKKNYAVNFLKHRRAGGGNYDSISIAIAAKELMKRPEKDKILIVLSDGLPASIENTKASIKAARDQNIHVVGIMFGDENFRANNYERYRDMYQKNIIAIAPNKISVKLAEVLKQILAR